MTPAILAIDPGTTQSAYVVYRDGKVLEKGIGANENVLTLVTAYGIHGQRSYRSYIVCEWIESYGMPVGAEVFHTCRWVGRFEQASGNTPFVLLPRREVKMHMCNSARAKDANIRQALIDRFGGSREAAIGTKARPGPLYGISSHCWAALAVAVTFADTKLGTSA